MGSKFCNLNLRGRVEQEEMDKLLPGLQAFPWDNGWTTLTGTGLQWGSAQSWAKKLSAALEFPVLSTEYFDDDYVEFAVYREGKRVARHVPVGYEGLRASRGDPGKFLEALGLNLTEAPRLKKIFQVKDCKEITRLLESFLGCPIFGIDEDALPTELPGPELARSFAGEESPVKVEVTKRTGKKDRPPYALTLEKAPCRGGVFETIFCYTDHSEKIVDRMKAVLQMWERRLAEEKTREAEAFVEQLRRELRILPGKNLTIVWGIPVVNIDVDLLDLTREFKCLVAACRVIVKGDDQIRVTVRGEERVVPLDVGRAAQLHCGLAYGKKLLCFGRRGDDPRYNKIMPEITLDSPWLTLKPGELVEAFERPDFWDAVEATGKLLGHPLYQDISDPEGLFIQDIKYNNNRGKHG